MKRADPEPVSPALHAELEALEALPEEAVDLAEMPEVTEWSGAEQGRFYRPVKKLLSVRLDADLIHWFKASGQGYQTRINAALRAYVQAQKQRA